jgi:hypothetical protein
MKSEVYNVIKMFSSDLLLISLKERLINKIDFSKTSFTVSYEPSFKNCLCCLYFRLKLRIGLMLLLIFSDIHTCSMQ